MTKLANEHRGLTLNQVWLHQLEIMEQSVAGIKSGGDDDDIERLHQFRVALRQTRTLLKLCRAYLPEESRFFAKEFKWLAGITSTVRDLDIQLFNAVGELNYHAEEYNTDFTPILNELSRQKQLAYVRLTNAMNSKRFEKLLASWRNYLSEQSVVALSWKPKEPAQKVIKQLAARECRRLWRKGKAMQLQSPPAKFHLLRIRVKRLRYLLLNFGYLFATHKKKFRRLLKALENLQSVLGTHQDAVKAIFCVQKMLKSKTGKTFSKNTVCCAQSWVESLTGQQQEARDQFFDAFDVFKQARGAVDK